MSTLTKLFVVLHVVLSLLLAAGFITFVNTIDNQRELNAKLKAQYESQIYRVQHEAQEAQSERDQAIEAGKVLRTATEQFKKDQNELQKANGDLQVKLAEADSNSKISLATITVQEKTVAALTENNSRLQAQVTDLRKSNDTAMEQSAQSSRQISDLTNRLDQTERERKYAAEQVEELKGQNQKLSGALQDRGVNPAAVIAAVSIGSSAGAPKINGVIREVRTLPNGLPYATISVGSADSVAKGMEFNIVEHDGPFLGKITIDSVELNEATGRITGIAPGKMAQIKPGVDVKTQL